MGGRRQGSPEGTLEGISGGSGCSPGKERAHREWAARASESLDKAGWVHCFWLSHMGIFDAMKVSNTLISIMRGSNLTHLPQNIAGIRVWMRTTLSTTFRAMAAALLGLRLIPYLSESNTTVIQSEKCDIFVRSPNWTVTLRNLDTVRLVHLQLGVENIQSLLQSSLAIVSNNANQTSWSAWLRFVDRHLSKGHPNTNETFPCGRQLRVYFMTKINGRDGSIYLNIRGKEKRTALTRRRGEHSYIDGQQISRR